MFVKKLKNIGGLSSLSRYINFLAGNAKYVPTTNSTAIVIPGYNSGQYWQVQNWYNGTTIGFNGKYADPASNIPYYLQSSSWSRAKGYISAGTGFSPYISVYPFNDAVGFGTKYNDSGSPPTGTVNGIHLDIDNGYVFTAHDTSPYISAYPFTTAGGFGTKFGNPATLPTSNGQEVQFLSGILFLANDSSPFINAYVFGDAGFGTKFSNPATLPTYGGTTLAVHPSGQAVGTGYLSGLYMYSWSISGFGTKYAQPSGNPYAYYARFSSTGNTIAFGNNSSSPYIHAYPFTIASGYGTKFANPATLPPAVSQYKNNLAFSYGAAAIAMGISSAPYIHAYAFSESTGFGTKYADPSTQYAPGSFSGGLNFN